MKKLKTRYIWISVAVSFLIAVGLLIGVTFTDGAWTKVVIVLLAANFIFMTLAIQYASVRTFRYKAKPKNYPTITYTYKAPNFDELLKNKGYKPRITSYGASYLKVQDKRAYKVVVINNYEAYFHPEDNNTASTANKSLEKCEKFIGFEIFLAYDEETLKKLPDFNIQGTNIYYAGLYIKEDHLICPNYIEPSIEFEPLYQQILQDLELSTIQKDEELNS